MAELPATIQRPQLCHAANRPPQPVKPEMPVFPGLPGACCLPLSCARDSLQRLMKRCPQPHAPCTCLLITACLNVPVSEPFALSAQRLGCEKIKSRGEKWYPVMRGSCGDRGRRRARGEHHLGKRPGFQLWGLRKGRAWEE